jgi:hypothetical protein
MSEMCLGDGRKFLRRFEKPKKLIKKPKKLIAFFLDVQFTRVLSGWQLSNLETIGRLLIAVTTAQLGGFYRRFGGLRADLCRCAPTRV